MLVRPGLSRSMSPYESGKICQGCLRQLTGSSQTSRRRFGTNVSRCDAAAASRPAGHWLAREYFRTNRELLRERFGLRAGVFFTSRRGNSSAVVNSPSDFRTRRTEEQDELPHTRRRRKAQEDTRSEPPGGDAEAIPPDASSRLTTASTAAPPSSLRRKLALYLSLSKPRLTFLVVLTAATPYGLFPTPEILSIAATTAPSLSAATLFFLTTGTFLASASANTFNMLVEPKFDALMSRTRNRPLVRKLVSSRAAAVFGLVTGLTGIAVLYYGCNPTTSFLGGANILLYAAVYTPLKRISTINTWVGAVVGAIPPLMGWTAAAGQYATAADGWRELLFSPQAEGGWWLAALLFAWQFPHFNALSHTIRTEYANAGYRMLCSVNPARNARVALRYSMLMFPICYGLLATGVVGGATITAPTTVLWVAGSSAANGWMTLAAAKFWWHQGGKGTARGLFWASVWHLPILLVLAMALKRGMWARVVESLGFTVPLEDDDVHDDFHDDVLVEDALEDEVPKPRPGPIPASNSL